MFSIINILLRVLVAEFYKQNLGLFLFIFFVMFGMVEGSQLMHYHISLITGIIQSTAFLIVVFCVWFIYGLKSLQFISSQVTKPQNAFLYVLSSLPKSTQLLFLFFTHIIIHAPVLLYVTAIAGVAFHLSKWSIGIAVIGFNLMLCFALSLFSWRKINNPISLKYFRSIRLPRFVKKHLAWFYGAFIVNDLKVMLVVTKLFSYLALYGFLQIKLDHYENRIALLGLLIGAVSHAVLIFEVRKWEDSYLFFLGNLPITIIKRYLTLAILFALISTPELFLLVRQKIKFIDLVGSSIFSISFLLFLSALVHKLRMDMDKYIQYLLIIFLVSFGLILFKLYYLLIVGYLFISYHWYKKDFYAYESVKL